jgi:hypothetical protein
MRKRAFRPSTIGSASYPSLREVSTGSLWRWGLCAGLLIGGPSCQPVRGQSTTEQKGTPPSKRGPTPDAAVPSPPPMAGVMPQQRIDETPHTSPEKTNHPAKSDLQATKSEPNGKATKQAMKKRLHVRETPPK